MQKNGGITRFSQFAWLTAFLITNLFAVIGGTVKIANMISRIEQRLDDAITYPEFIRWQQALRDKNKTLDVPGIEQFHSGGIKKLAPGKVGLAKDSHSVNY